MWTGPAPDAHGFAWTAPPADGDPHQLRGHRPAVPVAPEANAAKPRRAVDPFRKLWRPLSPASLVGADIDPFEPDDTCETAKSITVNGAAQWHDFHSSDDIDWVRFSATAGEFYAIRTENLGPGTDTVMVLVDPGCSYLILRNDDWEQGFLASRVYWAPDQSGVYYVAVTPFGGIEDPARSNYDLRIYSLPFTTVHVEGTDGRPTEDARVEVYANGPGYYDYYIYLRYTDDAGNVSFALPERSYTILAGSGWQDPPDDTRAFVLRKDSVVAPSYVTFRASEAVRVSLSAYRLDGAPFADHQSMRLSPLYFSHGGMGRTNGLGQTAIWASPGWYTAIAYDWQAFYHLAQPEIRVPNQTAVTLNASTMPVGRIRVNFPGESRSQVVPWGPYSDWGPFLFVNSGDTIVVSDGDYRLQGRLWSADADDNTWYQYLELSPWRVRPGSLLDIRMAPAQHARIGTEHKLYRPGSDFYAYTRYEDAFGNWVSAMERWVAEAHEVAMASPEQMTASSRAQTAASLTPSDHSSGQTPTLTTPDSRPDEWRYFSPGIEVHQPDGSFFSDTESWTWGGFYLPDDASAGNYTVQTTVDTGPFAGVLQARSTFSVVPYPSVWRPPSRFAPIYLPALFRYEGDFTPCNWSFETGRFDPCWRHGGLLAQSFPRQLDDGSLPYDGDHALLLGDPGAGPALPRQNKLPIDRAWAEQTISVPDFGLASLRFAYRMITYDVARDARGRWYDIFEVNINDGRNTVQIYWDGNQEVNSSQQRHDLGWRWGHIDLTPWRGRTVTVRFSNWNGIQHDAPEAEYNNTWTYLDYVTLIW